MSKRAPQTRSSEVVETAYNMSNIKDVLHDFLRISSQAGILQLQPATVGDDSNKGLLGLQYMELLDTQGREITIL
jgi:hypothetical protein